VVAATRPAAAQAGTRTQARCNGQPITEVVIRSQAPSFGGFFADLPAAAWLINTLHVTTEPQVIENFILLKKGQPCNPLWRYETERILRAQPFLADATVTAYADGPDGVRVEVVTVDEPSTVASLGLTSHAPVLERATLGSANVAGKGVYAVGRWQDGGFYRDTWSMQYANYQMFRRPYQLISHGTRRDLGYDWQSELTLPFFSDVQRFAWQAAAGGSRDYIEFRTPDSVRARRRISLGTVHHFVDAGGAVRVGRPGFLGIFGASVSSERAQADATPVIVTDTGLVSDTTSELTGRYTEYRTSRLNALLGFRAVQFMQVTGFDALNARQDVRTGVQVGATLGTGLPGADESARDRLYAALDLYAGAGSPSNFAAVQWRIEGRRSDSANAWDGVLTAGRLAWYLRPHRRHTVITDLEWGSGMRQRTPFQLSLGDWRGGVRGYEHAMVGGGGRVVMRVEERWRVGSFRGAADGGVAFFADAGRLWEGDAPLGRDTPVMPSVGIGLLAAIPPRSQRMWRLDFALPLRRRYGAGFEVRFSALTRSRAFWQEPNDILRNRERAVPVSVFNWP
jgi:hypothetical protein